MADELQAARQRVNEAKSLAETERQKNQSVQARLNELKSNLTTQKALRQKGGIASLQRRQLVESEIGINETALAQRSEAVNQFSRDVDVAENQVRQAEELEADYNRALKVFMSDKPEAVFSLENSRQRELFRQLQDSKETAVRAAIDDLQKQGINDTVVLDEIRTELETNLGKVSNKQLSTRINKIANQNLVMPIVTETGEVQTLQAVQSPVYEVSAYQAPQGTLERYAYDLSREKQQFETFKARGGDSTILQEVNQFGVKTASMITGNILFAKSLFSRPIETVKGIPSGAKETAVQFGEDVRTNPSAALGTVFGNILLAKTIPTVSGKTLTTVERLSGLPKYETTVFGFEVARNVIGDTQQSLVKGGAYTVRKGLFSDRKFLSGFYSGTKIGTKADDLSQFNSANIASTSEVTRDLVTGNRRYGNTFNSATISRGVVRDTPINILQSNQGGVKTYLPFDEGFYFRGSTQAYGGKKLAKSGQSAFIGGGAGTQAGTFTILKDVPVKNGKLTKPGQAYTVGFVKSLDKVQDVDTPSGSNYFTSQRKTFGANKAEGISKELSKSNILTSVENAVQASRDAGATKINTATQTASILRSTPEAVQSPYAGTGQYETQEVTGITFKGNNDVLGFRTNTATKTIPTIKQTTQPQTKLNQKQVNLLKQFIDVRLGQLTGQAPGQRTRQLQKNMLKSMQRARTQTRTKLTPKTPFLPFSKNDNTTTKKTLNKDEALFEIFARRFGKDRLIGKASTLKGASDLLRSKLKGSLAASGFITRGGGRVDLSDMLGLEFGKSKTDKGRVVQKRSYRLGTRSEVKEIIGYPKKQKNKNFRWF